MCVNVPACVCVCVCVCERVIHQCQIFLVGREARRLFLLMPPMLVVVVGSFGLGLNS